jgi:hypothetical protein
MKYSVDPMSTHSEFLEAAITFVLTQVSGEGKLFLLEIGTGGKSSEIMRRVIEENVNVELISFENDLNWIDAYRNKFPPHKRHEICQVGEIEDWDRQISMKLKSVPAQSFIVSFIDSAPWESRVISLNLLKEVSQLVLIHDVDYFPHNKFFGHESEPILFKPMNRLNYGKLKSKYLGSRTYGDEFKNWVEVFPKKPGYFTGPPTLVGSNMVPISNIDFGKNCIIQNKSPNSPVIEQNDFPKGKSEN